MNYSKSAVPRAAIWLAVTQAIATGLLIVVAKFNPASPGDYYGGFLILTPFVLVSAGATLLAFSVSVIALVKNRTDAIAIAALIVNCLCIAIAAFMLDASDF